MRQVVLLLMHLLLSRKQKALAFWTNFFYNMHWFNTTRKDQARAWLLPWPSTIGMEENTLDWWRVEHQRYPNCAKLAKKYLCICATRVPAERIFSIAGQIVSIRGSAFKPGKVDHLVFLTRNLLFGCSLFFYNVIIFFHMHPLRIRIWYHDNIIMILRYCTSQSGDYIDCKEIQYHAALHANVCNLYPAHAG